MKVYEVMVPTGCDCSVSPGYSSRSLWLDQARAEAEAQRISRVEGRRANAAFVVERETRDDFDEERTP